MSDGTEQVDRVEMKNRFAFVYMPKLRDAEAAIRGLNRAFDGDSSSRLRVRCVEDLESTARKVLRAAHGSLSGGVHARGRRGEEARGETSGDR
jgi:hypothetical protein